MNITDIGHIKDYKRRLADLSNEDFIKYVKKNNPKLVKDIPVKKFVGVNNYGDYLSVYEDSILSSIFLEQSKNHEFVRSLAERHGIRHLETLFIACVQFDLGKLHDFPIFFVSNEMLEACLNSKINFIVEFDKIKFPFPSMNFIFEKENSFKLGNKSINRCNITCCNDEYSSGLHENTKTHPFLNRFNLGSGIYKVFINSVFGDSSSQECLLSRMTDKFDPSDFINWIDDNKPTSDEVSILGKICGVIFNLIFAMEARPQYVETGKFLYKQSQNKKKNRPDVWSPNFVGRKYSIKKPEYEGTHASPRLHWRVGHFRQQAYGNLHQLRKRIWIEPTMVYPRSIEDAGSKQKEVS